MKKIFMVLVFILMFGSLFAMSSYDSEPTATQVSNENNEAIAQAAQRAYPTPMVDNFIERKTVSEWVERWDTPFIITYVYLFSFGNCIGYYVCDGKPASTQSYLEPEERYYMNGATLQTPSLDGTYGADQVGWIFFDHEGRAVSWQGQGASILFTDTPLPDSFGAKLLGTGTVPSN